jgi:sigma-B regulation protein RsbU (phosphoserine phosphatase)
MNGHSIQKGLKELLSRLNEIVVSSFHMEKYLTGFFLLYDLYTRKLNIADMGHAHSLFLRNGKVLSMKKARVNLPIGVEAGINPVVFSIPIESGDTLLVYSDGIPEQENSEGVEFGEDNIITLTKQAAQMDKTLSEILPDSIEKWREKIPQHDDMTFIQFKFK